MKHLIREEILYTKLKNPHNVGYIKRLQQMFDSDELTISDFTSTGVMMKRADYESIHHSVPLHKKCMDVIRYIGGHYIQMLSDGNYLLQYNTNKRGKRSMDLKKIEGYIWKIISSYEG